MPRVTRAAAKALEDEAALAAGTPLPVTPKSRPPLGEISGNKKSEAVVNTTDGVLKPAQTTTKVNKKNVKPAGRNKNAKDDAEPEVLEDDNASTTSSAVEEACQELLKSDSVGETLQRLAHEGQQWTPSSKAVQFTRKQLSPKAQTPRFNPDLHKMSAPVSALGNSDDSFVEVITARSPVKVAPSVEESERLRSEGTEVTSTEEIMKSKVEQKEGFPNSGAMSPARIEDTVAEMDALEDALENINEELKPQSPPKARGGKKAGTSKPSKLGQKKTTSIPPATAKAFASRSSSAVCPSVRPSMAPRKPSTSPITLRTTSKATALAPQGPTSCKLKSWPDSNGSSSKAPVKKPVKKRVASLEKPPFVPLKSSKPPTTCTFILPGERVAARLKAKKEEREKKEGTDKQPAPFKARPVKRDSNPTIRGTVASNARLSLAAGNSADKPAPKPMLKPRPSVTGPTIPPISNASATYVKSRPSIAAKAGKATGRLSVAARNSAVAPRQTMAGVIPVSTARKLSINQATQLKQKGKEVYRRTQVMRDEIDKETKEKQEAVQKAKAEAAEKGRQASREWAEKMKARRASAIVASSAS